MLDTRAILATLEGPVQAATGNPKDRSQYEGVANSPVMCAGCGYSLTDVGKCPKCGSTSREIATGVIKHELPDLLAGHKEAEKLAPKSTAVLAARATGKPCTSKEYHRAYQKAKGR